jgi:drug/metabolite transporter (DMT)-like permease
VLHDRRGNRFRVKRQVVAVISVGFIGVLFLFVAVFMCAVYTVYSLKVGDAVDALALVTIQQTAGLVWAAALFMVTSGGNLIATVAAVGSLDMIYAMLTGRSFAPD